MISGLPYLAMASSSASTQKLASSVFDSRQASTLRVAQSMIAIRYREAVPKWNVGNVVASNMVGPRDRKLSQQIWPDLMLRVFRKYPVNLVHQINRGLIKADRRVIDRRSADLGPLALPRQVKVGVVLTDHLAAFRRAHRFSPCDKKYFPPQVGRSWHEALSSVSSFR